MKKLNAILLVGLFSLVFFACEERLDLDPQGEALSDFVLTAPSNNTLLTLNSGTPDANVTIQWEGATSGVGSPVEYAWVATTQGGDINNPAVVVNAGTNVSSLTLTQQAIDEVLAGLNLNQGDTAKLQWSVRARVIGADSEILNEGLAVDPRNINIVRFAAGISSFALQSPANWGTLELQRSTPDADVEIAWNQATAVNATGITYTWEAIQRTSSDVVTAEDFATPLLSVASDNDGADTTLTFTMGALDGILEGLGLAPNDRADLAWRVVATAGGFELNSTEIYKIQLRRFEPDVLPALFIVGDVNPIDWNNSEVTAMFRNPANPDEFRYTGFFDGNIFKFLEKRGQWTPQWGLNGTDVFYRENDGMPDPGVFELGGGNGYFTITFNVKTLQYSVTSFDEASAADYATVGIIGDATPNDWGASTAMTQSSFDSHQWEITVDLIGGRAMKFRANDSWDVNWGDNNFPYGAANFNGDNIAIEESGTYTIRFNDLTGNYAIIKQ